MDFDQTPRLSAGEIAARLRDLEAKTGCEDLRDLADRVEVGGLEDLRDELSSRLMEVYRDTLSAQAFGLIYELNSRSFFVNVLGRLRRTHHLLDPNDILQEAFVNIYRYPHRFQVTRPQAFRYWANTIIRNTVLRFLRGTVRENRIELLAEEGMEPEDESGGNPVDRVLEAEGSEACRRAWLIYLALYLQEYNLLNERERRSLHLVEVEGFSYREVSAEMGIKVENLKMVIFRARKKIMRKMRRRLEEGLVRSREVTTR